MIEEMKDAAAKRLAKAEAEVAKLRREEREDLTYTVEEHTSMPDNYWEARLKAERILEAAKALCAALNEVTET